MLPHLRDRPLVLQRFPDGIDAYGFFQKDTPEYFPDWIRKVPVWRRGGGKIFHVVADDEATLAYLVDQACITFHVWLSRVDHIEQPDQMIFDLDPAEDPSVLIVAARALRRLLEHMDVPSFPKLTGGRGLHVHVPLQPSAGFDEVRAIARRVAELMVADDPDQLTIAARKAERKGRLFVDTLRNGYGQHAVAPYTVRPFPGAPIAMPVSWDEVNRHVDASRYKLRTAFRRLGRKDDPWKDMEAAAVPLARLRQGLDSLAIPR
jgi:bifunctional non-homologous end joining protein LigD